MTSRLGYLNINQDSRCYYDVEAKEIIHDAGPYSEKTCYCDRAQGPIYLKELYEQQHLNDIMEEQEKLRRMSLQFYHLNSEIAVYMRNNIDRINLAITDEHLRFIEISPQYRPYYNIVKEGTMDGLEGEWFLKRHDYQNPVGVIDVIAKYSV